MRRPSAALLLALTLTVTACGGSDPGAAPEEPAAGPPTSAPEEPAPEAAPAAEDPCDRLLAGYGVRLQPDEVLSCETGATSSPASVTDAGGLPATTADTWLSAYGIGRTSGATTLNHPSSGATDGQRLAIADRFNNRVLVFTTLPTGPVEPDLVLGQPDMTTTLPGEGLEGMNWPGAVEITPEGTLLVGDTENGRILVWNTFPTRSGQPADFALDVNGGTSPAPAWPWGLWSDGERLVVTDTRDGRILVWEAFPTGAGDGPDHVTRQPTGVGTPRNVTSDGSSFLIGDENGSQPSCWGGEATSRQTHVWRDRLPIGPPDGCLAGWFQGSEYDGGLIALGASGEEVHWWTSFPVDEASAATKVGGSGATPPPPGAPGTPPPPPQPGSPPPPPQPGSPQPGGTVPPPPGGTPPPPPAGPPGGAPDGAPGVSATTTHPYLGGDGGDVVVAGDTIYFIEYNGNRVTVWSDVTSVEPDADAIRRVPDLSLFTDDPGISTLLRDGLIQNPLPLMVDDMLVVVSDYDAQVHVWRAVPAEPGARADVIEQLGFQPWDAATHDGDLILAGKSTLMVWEDYEPGAAPTTVTSDRIGSVEVGELRGVGWDGTYLAISDARAGAIHVFEGVPADGQAPLRTIELSQPGRLDLVDGRLVVAPYGASGIRVADLSGDATLREVPIRTNLPMQARILPLGFVVADTAFHRVLVFSDVDAALAGSTPLVEIGAGTERPSATADGLFLPGAVEQVGGHLMVGEFKFSNRILGFPLG